MERVVNSEIKYLEYDLLANCLGLSEDQIGNRNAEKL